MTRAVVQPGEGNGPEGAIRNDDQGLDPGPFKKGMDGLDQPLIQLLRFAQVLVGGARLQMQAEPPDLVRQLLRADVEDETLQP